MGNQRCIICTSGHKKGKIKADTETKKVHFFQVPKAGLELWQKAISRKDITIKPGHSVCEKHFSKKNLLWRKELLGPNGVILGVSADYKAPKLREGALPTKHLGFTLEEQTDSGSESTNSDFEISLNNKAVDNNGCIIDDDIVYKDFEDAEDLKVHYRLAAEARLAIPKPTEEVPLFEIICNNEKSVALPPVWCRQNLMYNGEKMVIFSQFICKKESTIIQPFCSKQIVLQKNLETSILISRHTIEKENSEVKDINITSIENLEHLIKVVNTWKICTGLTINSDEFKASFIRIDKEGVVRSSECPFYMPPYTRSGCCIYCRRCKKTVSQKLSRMKNESNFSRLRVALSGKQKKKLDDMRQEIKTLRRGRERSLARIKILKELRIKDREEFKRSQKSLEQMLNESCLDPNQKLVTREMLAASRFSARGRRYSKMWISFCLTLHRKSPLMYKYLRQNNVLPLPTTQTLSRFAQQNPSVDQEISVLKAQEGETDVDAITDILECDIVPIEEMPEIEMETEVF